MLRQWIVNRGLEPLAFWQAMQDTGVQWDPTSNVLSYPRTGRDGSRVGWKRRSLETGKQWNDPAGVSHGSTIPFGLLDEDAGELWVTEGESDLLAIACQRPLPIAVSLIAVPGANAFPPEWVELIENMARIVVFPDNDAAGKEFVDRMASLVPTSRFVQLPEGCNDVTDFLKEHDVEDLVQLSRAASHRPAPPVIRRFGWKWEGKEASEFNAIMVEVIARDVVLKRKGKELVGLCPFHEEKSPSFHVNMERGVWRCHGCNAAGDVVTYVQKRLGLSYPAANEHLRRWR